MHNVFVIMAKHPTPGRVKTRLQPVYSAEQSAGIQSVFLVHLVERFLNLSIGRVVVCFDPPGTQPEFERLLFPLGEGAITFLPQSTGDLGARLADASRALANDFSRVFFFGVDSPDVPDEYLRTLVALLDTHDAVIAPTDDGGFWSMGVKTSIDLAPIFHDVEWSSGREMAQVVENLNRCAVSVALADAWTDVDRPADMVALMERLKNSPIAHDVGLFAKLIGVVQRNGVSP